MKRVLLIAGCGLGLALPANALASGGPVPPVQGGSGVSAAGGAVSFVAVGIGRDTVVERVDAATGRVDRGRRLPGRFGVPGVAYDGSATGLSADGETLVLAQMPGNAIPRRTRLVVLDARGLVARAWIALRGYYTVDAVSPTGRWLYLIHYVSQSDPTRYEVRAYDVPARRLMKKPVIDPREAGEAMRGFPITRVMSLDGRSAYTLYLRPDSSPFVHALDTPRRVAMCVDLPALAGQDVSNARPVLAPGSTRLRIELGGAPAALIDTRTFAVGTPAATRPPSAATRATAHSAGGLSWGWVIGPVAALLALALAASRRWRLRSVGLSGRGGANVVRSARLARRGDPRS
jgi:hypothetical protein